MKKKLVLKKEKITSLSNVEMGHVVGGSERSQLSSKHNLTCCWCSFGPGKDADLQ